MTPTRSRTCLDPPKLASSRCDPRRPSCSPSPLLQAGYQLSTFGATQIDRHGEQMFIGGRGAVVITVYFDPHHRFKTESPVPK